MRILITEDIIFHYFNLSVFHIFFYNRLLEAWGHWVVIKTVSFFKKIIELSIIVSSHPNIVDVFLDPKDLRYQVRDSRNTHSFLGWWEVGCMTSSISRRNGEMQL